MKGKARLKVIFNGTIHCRRLIDAEYMSRWMNLSVARRSKEIEEFLSIEWRAKCIDIKACREIGI